MDMFVHLSAACLSFSLLSLTNCPCLLKPIHLVFEHLKQTGSIDDQPRASYMQREYSEKSNSTNQSPPPSDNRKVYTPPSPASTTKPSFSPPPTEPMRSPPASPPLEKPSVRFNDRDRDRGYNDRPAQKVHRTYSTLELSTIDQKWGRLFDNESRPTERLGQFLRGLANHIVSLPILGGGISVGQGFHRNIFKYI